MTTAFIAKQTSLTKLWLHDSDLSATAVEDILKALIVSQGEKGLLSLFLGKCQFKAYTCAVLAAYIDCNLNLEFLKTTNSGANGAKSNIIVEVTDKEVIIRERASNSIIATL